LHLSPPILEKHVAFEATPVYVHGLIPTKSIGFIEYVRTSGQYCLETLTVTTHPNLQNSYPVQLLIAGRRVLVVGAGHVALRKIQGLLRAGAEVTVIAPWVHPLIAGLPVAILERAYRTGEASAFQLVIACTDDRLVNRQVFCDAENAGVWVNSADDPDNCSFILPAVARQGDLTLTISTNGQSPAMAMWLRRRFESEFDERYDQLMELLVEVRAEVRDVLGTSEIQGWNEALDAGVFELVAAGRTNAARKILRTSLGLDVPTCVDAEAGVAEVAVLRASGRPSLKANA